jgi:hypothetical protein
MSQVVASSGFGLRSGARGLPQIIHTGAASFFSSKNASSRWSFRAQPSGERPSGFREGSPSPLEWHPFLEPTPTRRGFQGMNDVSNSPRNRLLLALPNRHLKQLMPELEHIRCQRAEVLLDADSSLDYVFFPHSGVVSVVAVYSDGNVIEMATIGREGCSGVQAVLGAKRLLVQIPGSLAKMSRAAFMRAMGSMPSSELSCMPTFRPFSSRSWCRSRATGRTVSSSGSPAGAHDAGPW